MDRYELGLKEGEGKKEELPQTGEIRFGAICPKCLKGTLEYDGLLNLVCPLCEFTSTGCFT